MPTDRIPKKCGGCSKRIPIDLARIFCSDCKCYFHIKCSINFKAYQELQAWSCDKCMMNCKPLPFGGISNEELFMTLNARESHFSESLNLNPSFTIRTLLDNFLGENSDFTDDFFINSISSKYYAPSDFIKAKFEKQVFSMMHINIASLQCHIDDLRTLLNLLDHQFDVIAISETRLNENTIPIVDVTLNGYDFVDTRTKCIYGGTALYIKNGINYEIIKDFSKSDPEICESTFVELKGKKKKNLIVGCIYRHHCEPEVFVNGFLKRILNEIGKTKKNCAILGDFNIDLSKYESEESSRDFYDTFSSFGFRPLIMQPTRVTSRSATIIDNILINDITTQSVGGNLTSTISDHFPQFCQIDFFGKGKAGQHVSYGRSYKHFNQNEFSEELSNVNWNNLLANKNADDSFNTYFRVIEQFLDEMAPVKRLTKKEIQLKKRPWITHGILASIKDRDKLYKEFTKEIDPILKSELHTRYKRKRNMIVTLLRQSKKQFFAAYFEEHKSNVKKTWEGIRNIVKVSNKNRTSPTQLFYKNETHSTNNAMASAMNNFFVNIGNVVEDKIPHVETEFTTYLKEPNPETIFLNPVLKEETIFLISQVKRSKACGPNSIPTNILLVNIHILADPLTTILNKSILEGVFPNLLKLANVCPIYKKNDKSKCENYRPISLLSNLSKIFERMMHSRLYNFLESSNSIYKLQFGFRKKYSTNHSLLSIVESLRDNLDNKTFSCGVFVDLEKAFDTVNHSILLKKLEYYGIRQLSNKWLYSYLTDRFQKVSLNGSSSEYCKITCGVPQGSILGPLLFLLYINDMHKSIRHSLVHHFADDTNLLCSHKDPKVLRKRMNEDLKYLFTWLCANRLSLNVSKTEFIIFKPPRLNLQNRITLKLNGTTIYESKQIKYLGLLLDERLTWKAHIIELRKKLARAVGILYKLKGNCPDNILKSIYFSLFHSHISYGLLVWGNASNFLTDPIFRLQKKAIRIITNSDYLAKTSPLFKHLNILKLNDLIEHKLACLMWEYDHNSLPESLCELFTYVSNVHRYNTRMSNKDKLYEGNVIHTKSHGEKLLKCLGPKMLNKLKDLDFYDNSYTINRFKYRNKKLLLEKY